MEMSDKKKRAYEQAVAEIEQAAKDGLTELSLKGMGLTKVPGEIGNLTSLTRLYLSNNKLTELPVEIGKLTSLTDLSLGDNQLRALPEEIGQLTRLKTLRLENNQLMALPGEIGQLTSLTYLDLSGNGLTGLPGEIGKLTGLTRLYLYDNQLTALPGKIGQLTSLRNLDLSYNELTGWPVEIGQLASLTRLDLQNNRLTELGEWITELDMEIKWVDGLIGEGINLYGNPLERPPVEIVRKGREAVRNYFESLKRLKPEEVVRLYEAKLLVVGPGDVGKTFLSNRLIYGEVPPTVSTEGIDIHKWKVDTKGIKGFRINLWDFGGQEIYHATHQFFLTKRSLYVFVWEVRRDDDRVNFGYWLNVIKLLSDGAPVIMVMNKCDERRKEIDQAAIQRQFSNVIGFYEVSAEQNIGIEALRGRVIEEIEKLEQIGTTLPKQWVDIRGQLEGMKEDGKNYITYKEYQNICYEEHNLDKKQAGHLAGYYHELGVVLHFGDNPVLKDIVFLNPEWATDAVYAVTDHKPIQEKYGRFHFDELKGIWEDYPEDKYAALLALMMKFELCFNLEGTEEYIIPELLRPARCSFEWSYQDNLHFQYKYDFMPAGIITRFMVRKHNLIKDDLYWKNGAVMEWEGTGALIEGNEFEGKIDIWISGEDKKGMLEIIRCDIEHIHETLNRPVVAERMPCICGKCRGSTEPYFHKYSDLMNAIRKGKQEIECKVSFDDVRIGEILGEYGIEREQEDEFLRGKGGDISIEVSPQINVSPEIRQMVEVGKNGKKEEKKPWYKRVWVIIAGVIILLGGIWTVIQIVESDTFQDCFKDKDATKQVVGEEKKEGGGDGMGLVR